MRECWINVYEYAGKQWLGHKHKTKARASSIMIKSFGTKCIYRLHVKLKKKKPKN